MLPRGLSNVVIHWIVKIQIPTSSLWIHAVAAQRITYKSVIVAIPAVIVVVMSRPHVSPRTKLT